jgi:hypothetical protein
MAIHSLTEHITRQRPAQRAGSFLMIIDEVGYLIRAVWVLIYPFVTITTNFDVYNGQAYQGQFRRNILPN